MALSLIDVGTTANDGTGDPLRTAFQTVNTAITAVNNAVVVGTGKTTFKDDSGSGGLTVLSSGFVGVSTTTPIAELHVVGTAYIETALRLKLQAAIPTWDTNSRIWAQTAFGTRYDGFSHQFDRGNTRQPALLISSAGDISIYNGGGTVGVTYDASALSNAGAMGFGTATPTAQVDLSGDTIRVRTAKTPASAAATGNAGDICWDASYIYVCTATNTWKRAAIATW